MSESSLIRRDSEGDPVRRMDRPLLTVFSTAKPFEGRAAVLQRNAITSWSRLRPRPEVILFGDEPGVAEISAELGIRHVPEVARNEFGTPLVSDMFSQARRLARGTVLCYANCDIVFMNDLMEALRRIVAWNGGRPFLAIGTVWNVRVPDPIDYSGDWEGLLNHAIDDHGQPSADRTMDYFAFNRELYNRVPPFAVGRPSWDNWMVYGARKSRASVIDLTPTVKAVHQWHDYGHYPGGKPGVYLGEEARRNLAMVGQAAIQFGQRDATHVATADGVEPAWRARGLRQWARHGLRRRVIVTQASNPLVAPLLRRARSAYYRLRFGPPHDDGREPRIGRVDLASPPPEDRYEEESASSGPERSSGS